MSIIAFEEEKFFSAEMKHKNKSTQEIYDLLYNESEKISVWELFKDEYWEPFALYHLPKESAEKKPDHISHDMCIWYSYGKKYNRRDEKQTLHHPKWLFLQKEKEILECRFFGKNIIINNVPRKDQGRDSYYPNTYQYVTESDDKTIFRDIMKDNTHQLFIWLPSVNWDSNMKPEMIKTLAEFESKTHFRSGEIYFPIQGITVEDVLNDSFSVQEIIQDCVSQKKHIISWTNIDQIKKIWNQWVYKL